MKIGKLLHKVALLRPLLKLFGVKDGTVAAKVGEGIVIVDKAVNEPPKGDEGIIILVVCVVILLFAPVIYMVGSALLDH